MKIVKLTKGFETIVDDDDYKWVSKLSWSIQSKGYARSSRGYLHRLINKTPRKMQTDHINGSKLDNRKENLRTCDGFENHRNMGIAKVPKTSKYKGVHWSKTAKRWIAQTTHKKMIHIGCFTDETEAARAYDKKILELNGIFARPNFKRVEA